MADSLDALNQKYKLITKSVEENIDTLERLKQVKKSVQETLETEAKVLRNIETLERSKINLSREKISFLKDELRELQRLGKATEELVDLINQNVKAQEKEIELSQIRISESNQAISRNKMLIEGNLGISNSLKELFSSQSKVITNFTKYVQKMKEGQASGMTFKETLDATSKSLLSKGKALSFGIFDKFIASSIEFAKTQDEVFTNFVKSTGAGDEYRDSMTAAWKETRNLGVQFKDIGKSSISLYNNLKSFKDLNKQTQQELIKTTSQLEKLGVSSDTTTKFLNTMQSSFGMNIKKADEMKMKFISLSNAVGGPPTKAFEKFNKVSADLASYGDKAIDVFTEMMHQANALGTEIESLISVTKKMDTFEGAVKIAGQLNSVLGGNLVNSYQLLNAREEERIPLLRRMVQESNKSWDAMGKYERQALAAAAGIDDMNVAAQIFGKSQEKYLEAMEKSKERAKSQEELNELMQRAQPIQDKINALMSTFIITIEPLVDILRSVLDGFNDLGDSTKKFIVLSVGLIPIISKATFIFKAFLIPLKLIGAGMRVLGSSSRLMGAAAATTQKAGNTLAKSAPSFAAFGSSLLPLAGSIALVNLSLALVVGSFALLFSIVSDNIEGFVKFMGMFVLSMAALAIAAGVLGTVGLLAGLGLASMTIGLGLLAIALQLISTRDLEALGNIFSGLGKSLVSGLDGFEEAPEIISDFADEIEDIDFSSIRKLSDLIDGLSNSFKNLAKAKLDNIILQASIDSTMSERNIRFTDMAMGNPRRYSEPAPLPQPSAATNAPRMPSAPGQASNEHQARTLILKIDERELGRVIFDLINKDQNLKLS